MIRKIQSQDIDYILDYIKENYYKCMYLYLNLKKYGTNNPNVETWVLTDKNEKILAIVLRYFSAMHIYSEEKNYNISDILELVKQYKPSIICGEKVIIEDIFDHYKSEDYQIDRGFVRKLDSVEQFEESNKVEIASKSDFREIAELIYIDDGMGSSYYLDDLAKQLYNRNQEGYSRNYIIKTNSKIVSHVSTGAENDKIAIISYVITHPKYRKKGYAKLLCKRICKDLLEEGKKVYLINYTNESTSLYDSIGFKVCCEWARMQKDLKNKR